MSGQSRGQVCRSSTLQLRRKDRAVRGVQCIDDIPRVAEKVMSMVDDMYYEDSGRTRETTAIRTKLPMAQLPGPRPLPVTERPYANASGAPLYVDNPNAFEENLDYLSTSCFQPWIGLRLDDGRFVILRKLGFGGSAAVFLARDTV